MKSHPRPATGTRALAMILTALALAGCSGEGRPSVEQISESLTSSDSVIPVPQQTADCFAELLRESDLTDETLNAIVDRDADYKGSDDEQQELKSLIEKVQTDCSE